MSTDPGCSPRFSLFGKPDVNHPIVLQAVSIYKADWRILMLISAALAVPFLGLPAVVLSLVHPAWVGVGYHLFFLLFWALATPALTLAIAHAYLGRKISAGECLKSIMGRPLIYTGVLAAVVLALPGCLSWFVMSSKSSGLANGLATVVRMVSGLWIFYGGIRLSLCTLSVLFERQDAVGSLRRSWSLTQGGALAIYNLGAASLQRFRVAFTICFAVSAVPMMLATSRSSRPDFVAKPYSMLPLDVIALVAAPMLSGVLFLFYMDVRSRREGFTKEQLAEALDAGARDSSGVYFGGEVR